MNYLSSQTEDHRQLLLEIEDKRQQAANKRFSELMMTLKDLFGSSSTNVSGC